MKNKIIISSVVLFAIILCGWGSVGHKIINTKTIISFPSAMSEFNSWSTFLAQHASDADNRKNSDPNESPKHFIDIDEYNEFNTTGRIPQDYDSMVTIYGSYNVINNGILPWAVLASVDSLKAQFSRRDWNKAQQTAADLGHYVGDSHMPLHITKNYDGKETGQSGVHSRYESTMIGKYESSIQYTPDSGEYIADVKDFVFSYIYGNYKYVDSVLIADNTAKYYAGGSTSSTAYYQKLWDITGNFTIMLFSKASSRLASLIYTAWVNAGSPSLSGVTSIDNSNNVPTDFKLFQNYPNPFNPSTQIKFSVKESAVVKITVYNQLGQEMAIVANKKYETGTHIINFEAGNLSSGIYFYRIESGKYTAVKKMILMK